MEIQKEIEILKYQPVEFVKESDSSQLYRAVCKRWGLDLRDAFTASLFYSLGKVHGIRAERARKKGRDRYE